ncbi:hypothetical protein WH87_04975 [Devosia epidermidihirudinis]|uniref:DUF6874 domain-containing protein n=1 Tax=Devosia epidermidihirudinis TaxID=1293439 RepID=A0A0F5QFY1_9HYPH|nr:hypothetical protein [Devosia epidermidihirudinis]KKC39892.1 hypothetical protein WH87_04975 [Devosia epidermidihirudinis]
MTKAQFSKNSDQAEKAAKRFETIVPKANRKGYARINLVMDLTAADGVNGNAALDWDRLLDADDFNFMHDLGGISRHIDRATGRIGGHFLPRFTLKQAA